MRKYVLPSLSLVVLLNLSACGQSEPPAVTPDTHLIAACEEVSGAITRLMATKEYTFDVVAALMTGKAKLEAEASTDPRGAQLVSDLKDIMKEGSGMAISLPSLIAAHGHSCS